MGPSPFDDRREDNERSVLFLYSRPDCHLCDEVKPIVMDVASRYGVRVEERNVEDDPKWEEAYGSQIPVAFLNGLKLFKYRVDGVALEQRLAARLGIS